MTLTRVLTAASFAALLATAAHAQTADATTTTTVDPSGVQTTTTVDTTTGMATSATTVGVPASSLTTSYTGAPGTVTTKLVTNGPVPDTAENRAKYGQPMSRAGKRTAPRGN